MDLPPGHPVFLHLKGVSLVSETSLSVHLEMLELGHLSPRLDSGGAQAACRGQRRGPSAGRAGCPVHGGWGLRAGSPLLGLSPSAGTTARRPSRRGCGSISGTKAGRPRRGSWSCLFLPQSKTLIRRRIRLEAPPGSAIPTRGECEKAGVPGTGAGFSGRRLSLAPD